MGTRFRVVLYASGEQAAKDAAAAAFARVGELDATLSDYRESNELMHLCRQAGRGPVRVSDDLFRVLVASQDIAERSRGGFDVTAGPIVRLWREARRARRLPDHRRLAAARALTGWRMLRLDKASRTAQLEKPGMLLDVGGIAKGFAADEALGVLARRGISSALIAAGGDIAVSDAPPDRPAWTVAVAPLRAGARARELPLANAAVSTSGDAHQFMEIGGVRYSHIVDPRTGQALTGRRSVTVVAPTGALSDALATAVAVLGRTEGPRLVETYERAACYIQ